MDKYNMRNTGADLDLAIDKWLELLNGELKGDKGDKGDKPVRGVDYWTQADIDAIKLYVDTAILGGSW